MENDKMHDIAGPIDASDRVNQYAAYKHQPLENKSHAPTPVCYRSEPASLVHTDPVPFKNSSGAN